MTSTYQVEQESIGVAFMHPDGSIELNLRAEGPGDLLGHALMVYRIGDIDYACVLAHLGGLEPGQTKLVPPWPET
jgi:hypothetical protein